MNLDYRKLYLNKKGMTTFQVLAFVFFAFFIVVFLGIYTYGLVIFNTQMIELGAKIGMVGDVNFSQNYNDTMREAIEVQIDTADNMGVAILLGMMIVMMMVGFKASHSKRLWILMDLFIILIAFILSVYFASTFETFINTDPNLFTIYSTNLDDSSTFILNLPIYVPIAGFLIMILTYAVPRKQLNPITNEQEY
ncbi:hypothetical protein LCGC14_1013620 [marine sediment metagenome]|uniref:Uncharacterized protein n=1 Tax=marine sediment metagenome TaxID=412755 RepID=A0A0F9QHV3_9ZZZZ